jgi:hypothetical protein
MAYTGTIALVVRYRMTDNEHNENIREILGTTRISRAITNLSQEVIIMF